MGRPYTVSEAVRRKNAEAGRARHGHAAPERWTSVRLPRRVAEAVERARDARGDAASWRTVEEAVRLAFGR